MNGSPKPRFLPVSWMFVREEAGKYRADSCMQGGSRSSSPGNSFGKTAFLHSNEEIKGVKVRKMRWQCLPCLKSTRRDAVAAAQNEYQRRLSRARNIYTRLHTSSDLQYFSNTQELTTLPITSLYKHHLQTIHKRLPTALRDTCTNP